MSNAKYLLCIVTIEKDDPAGLLLTRKSIGHLTENTQWVQKIYSKTQYLNQVSDNVKIIKSPDSGIYNAMNLALSEVNSKWVLFLNSGDTLSMDLKLLCEILYSHKAISHTLLFQWRVNDRVFSPKIKRLRIGSAFSHQAAVISTDQFARRQYSEKFIYASDYEFFVSAKIDGVQYSPVEAVLSSIQPGGVSDTNREIVYREFRMVQNTHYERRIFNYLIYIYQLIQLKLKNVIKMLLGL